MLTTGTYRDGFVYPDEPVDWPEGMRVIVEILEEKPGIDSRKPNKSHTTERGAVTDIIPP